ncbi:MAG: helix-hairpin-helix domain-containing protein [Rikenellaceae bacterium]
MKKVGLSPKEARGVISLMLIISIIAGYKLLHDHIIREQTVEFANQTPVDLNEEAESETLFDFDPNTIQLPELMRLGLTRQEAVSIIRYREYGKIFRIKEDLFTCYGVSDSLYYALEPYIVIADTFKLKRKEEYASYNKATYSTKSHKRELLPLSEFLLDTVGTKYLVATGALSRRQAEVFVRWRDLSGIYDMDELRECYVVSDSVASMLEPYIIFSESSLIEDKNIVDINKADSTELRRVYGIGEKSVVEILKYRELLGGFYSVEQLSELKVVTESNYEKIIQQILCDSCDISKIDVNFASAKTIKGHPYIADKALRRLLKIRELKGGWSTIEEMIEDDIFNEQEEARLRPYLLFNKFEQRQVSGDEFL